jgi:hypothetical protein
LWWRRNDGSAPEEAQADSVVAGRRAWRGKRFEGRRKRFEGRGSREEGRRKIHTSSLEPLPSLPIDPGEI